MSCSIGGECTHPVNIRNVTGAQISKSRVPGGVVGSAVDKDAVERVEHHLLHWGPMPIPSGRKSIKIKLSTIHGFDWFCFSYFHGFIYH